MKYLYKLTSGGQNVYFKRFIVNFYIFTTQL